MAPDGAGGPAFADRRRSVRFWAWRCGVACL